jgi:hypothetical protein
MDVIAIILAQYKHIISIKPKVMVASVSAGTLRVCADI